MKKNLSVLILLTFFIVHITCTSYAQIIGSDKQSYDIESKTNKLASDISRKEQPKMDDADMKIEYIDWQNPELIKYEEKLFKYAHTSSNLDTDYVFRLHKYIENGNYKYDEEIIKTPLQDGDYAILYKTKNNIYYAIEYHNDGSRMGYVIYVDAKKTRTDYIGVFYEYRYDSNEYKEYGILSFHNKHVMIVNIEKEKNNYKISQFVYKGPVITRKDLLCYSINNNVYIINENSNLFVNLSTVINLQKDKMRIYKKDKNNKSTSVVVENVFNTIEKGMKTAATAIGTGAMGVAGVGGLVITAASIPIILPIALYMASIDK